MVVCPVTWQKIKSKEKFKMYIFFYLNKLKRNWILSSYLLEDMQVDRNQLCFHNRKMKPAFDCSLLWYRSRWLCCSPLHFKNLKSVFHCNLCQSFFSFLIQNPFKILLFIPCLRPKISRVKLVDFFI